MIYLGYKRVRVAIKISGNTLVLRVLDNSGSVVEEFFVDLKGIQNEDKRSTKTISYVA